MLSDDKYKDFTSKEYFLYMLLLNRSNISKSNLMHFSDKNGVFVYYTNKEITKQLKCDKTTSVDKHHLHVIDSKINYIFQMIVKSLTRIIFRGFQ